jgi:proline iminopeptidase
MQARRVFSFAIVVLARSVMAQSAPAAADGLRTGEHNVVLNGVRVWYRIAGSASSTRPPLVFLHGGPGYNSHSFSVLAGPRLEQSIRVVYYDERGSGRSERPWTGHYQLDTLVEDVEALRRALGVPKIALMGHSFGGTLALEYAAKYPEHVSRMILVGAASSMAAACAARVDYLSQHYSEILAKARADTAGGRHRTECQLALESLPDSMRERVNNESMFPNVALAKMQDSVDAASGLRNTGELSRGLFRGGLLNYHFASAQRLTMPVLILAGREDYAIGLPQQRALARALPNARIVEYERAGHFLYLDQPERFTREVVAFLSEPR